MNISVNMQKFFLSNHKNYKTSIFSQFGFISQSDNIKIKKKFKIFSEIKIN